VQRHDAHSTVDLTWATTFAITKWAPDPRSPWKPERTQIGASAATNWRGRRSSRERPGSAMAWMWRSTGLARLDVGNAYRVIARKEAR